MPSRTRPTVVLALSLGLLLAGCSDSDDPTTPDGALPSLDAPPVSAFAEGPCRLAAPDVIAIGEGTTMLGQQGTVPSDVKDGLRDAQDRVAALAETAQPPVKDVLDRLVVAVGLVRVRADGNTYEPALGEALRASYDAAVATCTGAAPSTGASAAPAPTAS